MSADSGPAERQLLLDRHAAVHSLALPYPARWIWSGLTAEQLRCRPTPGHNSIAWLLWHIARCEDVAVNTVLRGTEEVLDRAGWAPLLGTTSRHIGTNATAEEVDAISCAVNLEALLAYRQAVGAETRGWAAVLDWSELHKQVTPEEAHRAVVAGDLLEAAAWVEAYWANLEWTRGSYLAWLAIEHSWFHIGEMSVIRNLLL
jgi:hypothetical protein